MSSMHWHKLNCAYIYMFLCTCMYFWKRNCSYLELCRLILNIWKEYYSKIFPFSLALSPWGHWEIWSNISLSMLNSWIPDTSLGPYGLMFSLQKEKSENLFYFTFLQTLSVDTVKAVNPEKKIEIATRSLCKARRGIHFVHVLHRSHHLQVKICISLRDKLFQERKRKWNCLFTFHLPNEKMCFCVFI